MAERIDEQFGTSNAEPAVLLYTCELPDGVRDKNIHQQLVAMGCPRVQSAPGKEWFVADLEAVKKALNSVIYGSDRSLNYRMRKEQEEAVEKATAWFTRQHSEKLYDSVTHAERFLLNAKMRFGKCFTACHIAKNLGAKRVLLVTYKPEVISEWIGVVNNHVDFNGWIGMRGRRGTNENEPHLPDDGSLPKENVAVVCVSLQDLQFAADGSIKKRLEQLAEAAWDLIVFDEMHFGSSTERAKDILSRLSKNRGAHTFRRLDLSGTPFRALLQEDFCEEQVFTYSYLDEQKAKALEVAQDASDCLPIIYRGMPDLRICTIELTDQDIARQREQFLNADLDFSLNELFRVAKKSFVNNDAVLHFVERLCSRTHDARASSVFGKLGDTLGVPLKRHSVWWMQRVESARLLAAILRKHPYFRNFEILCAAGGSSGEGDTSDRNVVKDKQDVELAIARSRKSGESLGTITLTVKRFLTGVTVPEWESILVLNDVDSAESYYQAIFRVQSSWANPSIREITKPQAWVFDFAVTRCLRLVFQYASALEEQKEAVTSKDDAGTDDLGPTVDALCETLNLTRFYEGKLIGKPTTAREVFEAVQYLGSQFSLARRITSDAIMQMSALRFLAEHPHLLDVLSRIRGYKTLHSVDLKKLVEIGIEEEKLRERKPLRELFEDFSEESDISRKKKKVSKNRNWVRTQVVRLAICMADFIYMTEFRERKIGHVVASRDPELFRKITGIEKHEFSELCELGLISREALNRIVRDFRLQEESSIDPEEFVLRSAIKRMIG